MPKIKLILTLEFESDRVTPVEVAQAVDDAIYNLKHVSGYGEKREETFFLPIAPGRGQDVNLKSLSAEYFQMGFKSGTASGWKPLLWRHTDDKH